MRPAPVRGLSDQGQVAQSVEQGTENPRVGGSIPSLATIFQLDVRLFRLTRLSKYYTLICVQQL